MSSYVNFLEAFGPFPDKAMPSFKSYIEKMVTDQEMHLIVVMRGSRDSAMTLDQIASGMKMESDEVKELLENCETRDIVIKEVLDETPTYAITDFPSRVYNFALWEDEWNKFPRYIKRILSEWLHKINCDKRLPAVERLKKGEKVSARELPNMDILLMDEVMEMVENATDFAITTCDCRTLDGNCDFPTDTCVRFNGLATMLVEQGRARRVTREEMKELITKFDKKGLMHTSNKDWKEAGLSHLCNCCNCCCYPFRDGIELESDKLWPKSYYVAKYDKEECSYCGVCVKRCQFGAFEEGEGTLEINGKTKKEILFDPEKCWGCGLCANTCPTDSILMKPLEQASATLA